MDDLQAQGSRLYASEHDPSGSGDLGQLRIITSMDGGISWQFADATLASRVPYICQYRAAPAGTTIFAVTISTGCHYSDQGIASLWRSDDAGAHWTETGALTDSSSGLLSVTSDSHGAAPIVYEFVVTRSTGKSPASYRASLDGGHTWQAAPLSGIPPVLKPFFGETLTDGTNVVAFVDPSRSQIATLQYVLTFYAWKAGQNSWHQISPPTTTQGEPRDTFITRSNGGRSTIWLVTSSATFPPATYTIQRYTLGPT